MSAMSAPGVSDSVQAKRPWEAGYGDIDHPQIGSGSAVAQIRKPRFVDVNISAAYEHHCHNTHGRSDPDFVREQYEKDYPIVNPNGETESTRRGMPDGHDAQGNAMYHAGVPPGVNLEMMRASLLNNSQGHSYAPTGWQAAGLDTCAAKREASAGNSLYNTTPAPPTRTRSSYTYSYTPGREPWKEQPRHEEDIDGDSNLRGITGGLGLSAKNSQNIPNSQDSAVDVSSSAQDNQ